MLQLQKLNKNDIFVMICVWFAAIVSLISDSLNQIALYVALPIAFITTFVNFGKLEVNKYFRLLVLLYVWILFSVIWATDMSVAMNQMKQILGSFILCYIFAVKARNERNMIWLYIAYFLILGFAWYYAYNNIFALIEFGEERLNDSKLNANTLAYYTFYFTFASFILGEISKLQFWKRIMRWVFILTIPLSFYTAIYTASRQILLIQIPLIVILLYIRYLKGKSISRTMTFAFIFGSCTLFVLPSILQTYNDSYLSARSEEDIKDDPRTKLAENAFRVGLENFPIGVGPGNFRVHSYNKHFSHNTYLELWANEGIVGLIIYLSILTTFIKRQWKRYKKFKDNIFLSFLVFGVFFIVDGIFYSFYEHLWLIGFLILVISHSESYYINLLKYKQ